MVQLSKKILISCFVLFLAGTSLYYGFGQRKAYIRHLALTDTRNALFYPYPAVDNYNQGLRAWIENNSDMASRHFQSALRQHPLFVDAWIKLAESALMRGEYQHATDILIFLDHLTQKTFYRKWELTLLAFDLQNTDILVTNTNQFIGHHKKVNECLYLTDQHFRQRANIVAEQLIPDNRRAYFQWLLHWRRLNDCATVWPLLTETDRQDEQLMLSYTHFLIHDHDIDQALEISRGKWYPGTFYNGSFEQEPLNKAYDWRYWKREDDDWQIRRVQHDNIDGYYALQISFRGNTNIRFQNLFQIVPVEPDTTYQLTYWWKSDTLTTDQRPFFEISGFDTKGFHTKGPMAPPDQGWTKVEIPFQTPKDGQAITIRLRRQPSKRIDNKLRGRLLLDYFELHKTDNA